jgi:hypothetical protein
MSTPRMRYEEKRKYNESRRPFDLRLSTFIFAIGDLAGFDYAACLGASSGSAWASESLSTIRISRQL